MNLIPRLLIAALVGASAAASGEEDLAKITEQELEDVREQISDIKQSIDRAAERRDSVTSELQEAEFASETNGYTATKHQREAGTGYFDAVSMAITGGQSSTTAMGESTETAQFKPAAE